MNLKMWHFKIASICLGLSLLIFTTAPCLAQSLFFTDAQSAEILRLHKRTPREAAPRSDLIVLDAIMYRTNDEWTIWLNGRKTTQDNKPDNINFVSVTPRSVSLFLTNADPTSDLITLSPGQGYDMTTHDIISLP